MIFDTDILIWIQRGNTKAAKLVEKTLERAISIQTYMELLQCAPSKKHHQYTKDFLQDFSFSILPITQNISHRAAIYIEEYALGHGIRTGDALIAATATENNLTLYTSNQKNFKCIKELRLKVFKP